MAQPAAAAGAWPEAVEIVDSHTEGEPTRVVVSGWPQPDGATMAERRAFLLARQDRLQLKRHAIHALEEAGRINTRPGARDPQGRIPRR